MQKETEIKLRASAETLEALREHPLLKKRNKSGWQEHPLFNQYYDTPARDLAGARVALRLRRDGDTFIQTLKSRGQSVAGLSERHEWDWYLERAELDTSRLTDDCWPAALAGLDKTRLVPIFTTDFIRQKADIAWGRGKAKVAIEAALDQGQVIAGDRAEPICELELELREGEPAALLELAIELARDLPLMPCDISKAERGYRLHDPASYSVSLPAPSLDPAAPLDQALAALGWHLLGNSQRLAEQYRFSGQWSLLSDWLAQLIDLRALLGSLGQAAPRASSRELRAGLDALLADWRPLIAAGQHDEQIRRDAPAAFAAELDRPRWGLLSLQISLWLYQQAWKNGRNAQGERQGQAELAKWLNRTLVDEFQALKLAYYRTHPAALTEQQPRLERLLVWLRLARSVLSVPEADRLYGELAKLQSLSEQTAEAEQITVQVQTVAGLKAYKALMG